MFATIRYTNQPLLYLLNLVAEHCAPVWARSTYTRLVDAQLNNSMRLISGTLRPTPLPWLPVLSHIEPPASRRKAAVDRLVAKATVYHAWRLNNDLLHPPQHRPTPLPWLPVLSHIEPLSLRHKAAVVAKATVYHARRLNNDLLHPPQHRLTSCLYGLTWSQWTSPLNGKMIRVWLLWPTVT